MKNLFLFLLLSTLVACGGDTADSENTASENPSSSQEVDLPTQTLTAGEPLDVESLNQPIDLNMDINSLSLSDIRILRNSFAAKQGYCFMKADLRAVFSTTTWYDEKMEERYWAEEMDKDIPPISYTKEEQAFIDKLKTRENELLGANYLNENNTKMANINNIVNLFQLEETDPLLMEYLGKNGFAIVPNNQIQLFHTYEENDYAQFPNFVTTDMYMQLFHMYFGYILRRVEEERFIPILSQICSKMVSKMQAIASTAETPEMKELANYNATFYAIAFSALTDTKIALDAPYHNYYTTELKAIDAASDDLSEFLDYTQVEFPYSLFKPRGHYTRNENLKRYFKAMMWLQTAPFCLSEDLHLKRAILSASCFAKGENFDEKILKDYKRILEPINFIIGEPDNVSFLNIAQLIDEQKLNVNELLTNQKALEKLRKDLKKMADAQNLIRPKESASCVDKINFMPQRYLADNEILQELIDVDSKETKRGYPKGLDVMAAFGSGSAEHILINELKEGEKWKKYPEILAEMKTKMKGLDWDATIYNKWISSLLELQKTNKEYPYFMQTKAWDKKDLNASLASWAELKHDAILYAEQPMAAECGGGGPPSPYTVGYVEPNIAYWNAVLELIDLTSQVLDNNEINTKEIQRITVRLKENAQFLKNISEKELKGEKLTEQEYSQIEYIGSTFEWITLDLVKQKNEYLDSWENVTGPDKSVAVIADIFTSNAMNNPDRGILHVGTGNVNDIFVVVEIEGYLYLTKGAVFSFHEFHLPLGNRLTDEEWQDMLEKNEAPEVPDWVKEIIVPIDAPKNNEKIFYSSGC